MSLVTSNYRQQGDLVLKRLNVAISQIKGRTKDAIQLAGEYIMEESKRLTPVDTGNLRESHFVEMQVSPAGFPLVRIGATAEYAIYVHENLEANHPNGGQAKFLEEAYKRRSAEAIKFIRDMASV